MCSRFVDGPVLPVSETLNFFKVLLRLVSGCLVQSSKLTRHPRSAHPNHRKGVCVLLWPKAAGLALLLARLLRISGEKTWPSLQRLPGSHG